MNSICGARGERGALVGGGSVVARRLALLGALSIDDVRVLNGLKGRTVEAGALVTGVSGPATAPALILSGWCARVSAGGNDDGQITTLLLPGDGFGIGASPWAGEHLPVRALTATVLLDATGVRQLVRLRSPAHSKLIEACRLAAWLEQIYALNQIARLGRQKAYQRVAHFATELYVRLGQIGLVQGNRFAMPLKQEVIADVLGLSCVHFNRTVRQMKSDGLLEFPRGGIEILDPVRVAEVAGFDVNMLTPVREAIGDLA